MSKRRGKKSTGKGNAGRNFSPMRSMRAGELHHFNIRRLLEERNPESEREMEEIARDYIAGKISAPEPRNDLEMAQNLMYRSWLLPDKRSRMKAARRALQLSPDCADAYVLLAEEEADTAEEAAEYFQKGVDAGERTLGAGAIMNPETEFWNDVVTRPYLRARLGLASALEALGRIPEADTHFREVLRLNPEDNQGARYMLLHMLMASGSYKEAKALLAEYPHDGSVEWHVSKALTKYHLEGKSAEVMRLMKKAMLCNPFFLSMLATSGRLPDSPPETVQMGGPSEAVSHAIQWADVWAGEKDFLEWVLEELSKDTAFFKKLSRRMSEELGDAGSSGGWVAAGEEE